MHPWKTFFYVNNFKNICTLSLRSKSEVGVEHESLPGVDLKYKAFNLKNMAGLIAFNIDLHHNFTKFFYGHFWLPTKLFFCL